MITQTGIAEFALLFLLNYYLTTFTIWFGHWFSHLKRSPLAGFHLSGHHVIYFNSEHLCSERFQYGSGKQDSSFALVPPLILQAILLYALLPLSLFLACLIQGTAITVIIGYIHIQIHVRGSKFERFRWFRKARRVHALHHDVDVNYMVADHFWDKVFRTYAKEPHRPRPRAFGRNASAHARNLDDTVRDEGQLAYAPIQDAPAASPAGLATSDSRDSSVPGARRSEQPPEVPNDVAG